MSFNPNKARQSFGGGSKPTGGFKVPDERGDGFDYDTFSVFVENNEGRRRSVYKDSEGIPTIGVGFNLTRHDAKQRIEEVGGDYQAVLDGKQDLSDDQVNQLLQPDLRTAVSDARNLVPKFDELSSERQRALADMSFNMGRERLGGFVNMLGAIEDGDWDAVQREAKDSKWFSQVGNRGPRVVELLGQGGPQNIEIARQDEERLPGKFDPQKARAGVASRLAQQQLNTVRDVDPQVASEAAALSKASGVSSHELTRNQELRDRLKTRLKSAVEQEALASSPATGRMLARSDFAAQAHDDVAALTQVEASAQSLQTEQDRAIGLRQTLGNALRRGGLRIAAGVNQAFGEDEAEEAGDVGRTFGEILEDEMTWGTTKDGKVVKSWIPGAEDIANAFSRYIQSKTTTREEALANAQERLEKVGELNARSAAIPKTAQSQRFSAGLDKTESFAEALALIRDNPVDALVFGAETAVESAPQLGAGVGAGLLGGPLAGVAVTGLASGATERFSTPAEFFASQGFDMGKPEDVSRLLGNPQLLAEGARQGEIRGSVIGAADALSFRLASLGFGNVAATVVGQTALQTGLAGAGEAGASALATGQVDHKAVIAEMLGEMAVGGPVEAISQGAFRGDMNRAVEARRTRERIEEIRERLVNTKLAERNPEAAAEHFAEAMPEPKEVFIPIDAIDAYIQGTGRNTEDVYNELGILEEAKAAHEHLDDVRIDGPTLGRIMLDEDMHTALAEHIRRDPDAMTDFEAGQFEEELADEFDATFAQEEAAIQGIPEEDAVTQDVTPAEPANLFETEVQAEEGFVYHATNAEALEAIAESGVIETHAPDFGTDQATWPDGSTDPRSYFSADPEVTKSFAPEEGQPVVLRVRRDDTFGTESGTGDLFASVDIPVSNVEFLGADGQWHALGARAPGPELDLTQDVELAPQTRGETPAEDLALFRMEAARAARDDTEADRWQVIAAEIRDGNTEIEQAVEDFTSAEGADLVRATDRLNELVIKSPHQAILDAQDAIAEAEAPSNPDMLPASADVSLARDELGLQELFRSGQEAGMTPRAYESYLRAVAEAADGVQKRQERKLLKKRERQVSEEIAREREVVREQMRETVQQEPVYAALNAIGAMRLDRDALIEALPEDFNLSDLPKMNGRNIYTSKGEQGVHPDVHAQMYGFDAADTMAFAMADAIPEAAAIDQRTDAEMSRRHPDLMEEARQIEEAIESLHDDRTSRVLEMEMNALRQARGDGRLSRQLIRAEVNRRMGNTKISEIRTDRLLAAERKNGKLAGKLLKQGDRAGAADAKFRQLINYEMAKKAFEARRTIDRQRKFMQKFTKEGKKFPTLNADYVDAIKQLLGQYDLGPKLSQKKYNRLLTEWMQRKQQEDGAIFNMPDRLWAAENQVNWQDMTVDEFESLYLGVKNIEAQARAVDKIIRQGQEMTLEQAKAEMFEASAALNATSRAREAVKDLDPGILSRVKTGLAWADAALAKVEFMTQRLDNFAKGGAWHRTIFQPFAEAGRKHSDMAKQVQQPLTNMLRNMPKQMRKNLGKKIHVEALGRTMRRSQLVMIALNAGNASNLGKMVRGSEMDGGAQPWTEEGVREALGLLTKEEGDFVQAVWDTFETMRPEVERIFRAEFGVSPPKIAPTGVMIGGEVRKGGYFPMKYRNDQNAALPQDALAAMQAPQHRSTVYAGFTEARTGYAAPVDLNMDNLGSGLYQAMHYITHYEAVRDVMKVLRDNDVKTEVSTKLGPEYYTQMTEWARAVATAGADQVQLRGWDEMFTFMRANFTAAVMVGSYTTLAAQLLGWSSSISQLSQVEGGRAKLGQATKFMSQGMLQSVTKPKETWMRAMDMSDEMRHRVSNFDRDVNDAITSMGLSGRKGKIRAKQEMFNRIGLRTIGYMQLLTVDLPTWTAGYNQAIAQNKTPEQAAKIADQMIRTSQGSGALKDQSAIQRTRGLTRTVTMFSTFTMALYNMQKQTFGAAGRSPQNAMQNAIRLAVLVAVPAVLDAYIRQNLPDDEDELLEHMALRSVGFGMSSIPVLGKGIDSAIHGFDPTLSPIESIPPSVMRALDNIADAIADGDDLDSETIRSIFVAAGATLGIGGTFQINRVWKAIEEGENPYDYLIGPKDE